MTAPYSHAFSAIIDDFKFIDDWDEKYIYIIDLGRQLKPLPEKNKTENSRVRGCASQVWLDISIVDGRLVINGDSDASTVKGLVAIVIALFNGLTPTEAKSLDAEAALSKLDLAAHFTPQRSNGIASMIARIRAITTIIP